MQYSDMFGDVAIWQLDADMQLEAVRRRRCMAEVMLDAPPSSCNGCSYFSNLDISHLHTDVTDDKNWKK